jgi:ribulose-phosphate 3-epimerase
MRARKLLHETGSTARLEVDGGIDVNTLSLVRAAGADTFVAGNALFKHPQGVHAGVEALLDLLQVPEDDQDLKEFITPKGD